MPDTQSSPVKVYRHPIGLPGKLIKLPKESRIQNAAEDQRPQNHKGQKRDHSPLGISIDTNVTDTTRPQPSSAQRTSPERRPWQLPKDLIARFTPTKSPSVKDISPFDREVPLVFSNENTPRSASEKRGHNDTQKSPRFTPLHVANDEPKTPAIILHSPLSEDARSPLSNGGPVRPKPASSIYTLAPLVGKPTPPQRSKRFPRLNLASIPPIPRMGVPFATVKTPASIKTPHSFSGTNSPSSEPNSAASSKQVSPDGPWSNEARNSMGVVPATPRRSKGWWNLILSPFEAKKMSLQAKGTPRMTDPDAPDVPPLDRALASNGSEGPGAGSPVPDENIRTSLMSIPHRNTIPYVGAAAEYYNPNERFGEDMPIYADEHEATAGSRGIEGEVGPGAYRQSFETAHEVSRQQGEEEEEEEESKGLVTPRAADTATEKEQEPAAHAVVPPDDSNQSTKEVPIHKTSKPREQLAEVPQATYHAPISPEDHGHYFSGFSSEAPAAISHQKNHDEPHNNVRSPSSPETAFSPGVVEVADARHFQSARSIHTKSFRRSSLPLIGEADGQENHLKRPHLDRAVPPPLPQKPAIPQQVYFEEKPKTEPQFRYFYPAPWEEKADTRFPRHDAQQSVQPKTVRKRRFAMSKERIILLAGGVLLFFILLLALILCLTVTRHHNDMPIAASWLNLTGYPALPTGIATIAQPNVKSQSSCVSNADLWSCSLPQEQQAENAPYDADQPNMRLEIRFVGKQKELTNSSTSPVARRSLLSRALLARTASETKDSSLVARSGFDEIVKAAIPAPPSADDQEFLGNTTDGNAQPFGGEDTPFIISFLPVTNSNASSIVKRDDSGASNSSDAFNSFPAPIRSSNNTAAPAALLPNPQGQPLRLFNRGQNTEHYGFYTYFDRSLFMQLSNTTANESDPLTDAGGSARQNANARCTWSQTRFLVQIWTKPNGNQQVSPALDLTGSSGNGTNSTASATNFSSPGTFPLPITITLDRHGGDSSKKAVFCYGLDQYQRFISDQKGLVGEARSFNGVLVNPAPGPFEATQVSKKHGGYGGSDGGSGGCSCQWTNF